MTDSPDWGVQNQKIEDVVKTAIPEAGAKFVKPTWAQPILIRLLKSQTSCSVGHVLRRTEETNDTRVSRSRFRRTWARVELTIINNLA